MSPDGPKAFNSGAPQPISNGMGTDPQPSTVLVRERWAAVGHAGDVGDPVAAAQQAVAQALAGGEDPKLLIACAAAGLATPKLAQALADAAGGVPLVGASTARPLVPAGTALTVIALGGPGFAVSTVAIDICDGNLREAGIEAAAALGDVADREHQALLLLSDADSGDQAELVRGAYSIAGAGVTLIGATTRAPGRQLHDAAVRPGAVVAAAIGSDGPFGVGVAHGWQAIGQPLHVTRTEGVELLTLDGRPALDVYLERTAAPEGIDADPEALARFADAHPLGVRLRADEEHVRLVLGADTERRTLHTTAELPQGGLAWLMVRDGHAVAQAARTACDDAVRCLNGRSPIVLLAFGELATLPAVGTPLAGLSGAGEFARARGAHGFHNCTHAVLAVA
jgi:hypothetical protein